MEGDKTGGREGRLTRVGFEVCDCLAPDKGISEVLTESRLVDALLSTY